MNHYNMWTHNYFLNMHVCLLKYISCLVLYCYLVILLYINPQIIILDLASRAKLGLIQAKTV